MSDTPQITGLTLHRASEVLEVTYADGSVFRLPFEYLRVQSPSAEVRGHGVGQAVLQTGKRGIKITDLQPVGQYAVRPVFSDGHDSGLYTWAYLYQLGAEYDTRWAAYLAELEAQGASRDPAPDAPQPAPAGGCGSPGCGGGTCSTRN